MSAARHFTLTGWHVLGGFTAFFLLIIALDVGFAVMAYRSFPGQSARNPYEAGLAYNQALAQRDAAAALGWRVEAGSGQGIVRVRVTDRDGAAISGLSVTARARRPATETGTHSLRFRAVAEGWLEADAPGSGTWDIEIDVQAGGGPALQAERRMRWP